MDWFLRYISQVIQIRFDISKIFPGAGGAARVDGRVFNRLIIIGISAAFYPGRAVTMANEASVGMLSEGGSATAANTVCCS